MPNHPSKAVPKDHPLMIAWEDFKATPVYTDTLRWAGMANEGNLWAMFVAGWKCGQGIDPMGHIPGL
jgi:hypothetical protein